MSIKHRRRQPLDTCARFISYETSELRDWPYPSPERLSFGDLVSDGPVSEKEGAHRMPFLKPRSPEQLGAVSGRRGFGSTEKILRRNRKTWTRLFAKRGRQLDKEAIVESAE